MNGFGLRHPYAVLGILALALAWLLTVTTYIPPLQDFNEWIYQGALMGRVLRGAEVAFVVKTWPVPNSAAQIVLGVFNLALPPRIAGIAYLGLYLVAFGWLAWRLAERDGRVCPATFLLLVVVGVLNSPYWDGYANYQLGLFLLMLHVWLRRRPGGLALGWELAFGVAIFFCHAIVLAVYAMLAGYRFLADRDWRRMAAAAVVPVAMLAWYVAADQNYGEYIPPIGTTPFQFIAYKAYTLAKSGPYQNMVIDGVGDVDRAAWLYYAGVGVNLLFVVVALLPLAIGMVRAAWRRPEPESIGAVCCLIGFAVLPSSMFGVVNIGERLLLPGLLLGLAVAPDVWALRRFGAAVASVAPAMAMYFIVLMPGPTSGTDTDHLAINDPVQRYRLLFWHRPFQFREQIAEALRSEAIGEPPTRRLGFTTSLLAPRPVAR